MHEPLLGLFKLGKREHIEQFARGLLYMNTLEHFVKVERNEARHDPDEGITYLKQAQGALLQVRVREKFEDVGTIQGAIRWSHEEHLAANVFCMLAIRTADATASFPVDPRNFHFGDTFAVVLNGDDFIRRVHEAAIKTSHEFRSGVVEYVDMATYEGPMGILKKSIAFSYQREFRMALLPGTGKPHVLEIGDISDNVFIGPVAELNERLRFVRGETLPPPTPESRSPFGHPSA